MTTRSTTFIDVLLALGILAPPVLVAADVAPSASCLLSVFCVLLWLMRALATHATALLLAFLGVAFVTAVLSMPGLNLRPADGGDRETDAMVSEWARTEGLRSDLPIVLHIVLDEMMSTGAMEDDLPGARQFRDALYTIATEHGLRTFDSVYSRRYYSGISLPNLMNAEFEGRVAPSELTTEIQEVVRQNAYFSEMAGRGYRTVVFQTAVMDFCQHEAVRRCETFRSFDPAEGVRLGRSMRDRVLSLAETLLRSYEPSYISQFGLQALSDAYGFAAHDSRVQGSAGRYDVQGFSAWFNHFTAFLERVPRGTHVFAHFMVPHAPYLLGPSCAVGGTVSAGYSLASRTTDPRTKSALRLRHYEDYLKQVACVGLKLDEMLRRLRSVPAFADATIVIHGDHGSRISSGFEIEALDSRDFVDNYATYFAARAPGLAPGRDCEFTSLPQIFRRIMRPDVGAGAGLPLPVLVATRAAQGARVEAPMPVFGCAVGRPAT